MSGPEDRLLRFSQMCDTHVNSLQRGMISRLTKGLDVSEDSLNQSRLLYQRNFLGALSALVGSEDQTDWIEIYSAMLWHAVNDIETGVRNDPVIFRNRLQALAESIRSALAILEDCRRNCPEDSKTQA